MNPTKLSVSKSPSNWIPRFYSHEVCWHLNALILVRLEKLFIFSFFSFSITHWSEIFQNLRVYKDLRWQSLRLTSFYLYCTSLSFGIMKHNANVLVIMVLWSLIKDLFICKTKFVVSVTHCCVQSIFFFFFTKNTSVFETFFLLIDKTKFSEIIYFSLNKQTVSIYKIFLLILSSSQRRLQTSKII